MSHLGVYRPVGLNRSSDCICHAEQMPTGGGRIVYCSGSWAMIESMNHADGEWFLTNPLPTCWPISLTDSAHFGEE